jgi:hypothetical protein
LGTQRGLLYQTESQQQPLLNYAFGPSQVIDFSLPYSPLSTSLTMPVYQRMVVRTSNVRLQWSSASQQHERLSSE